MDQIHLPLQENSWQDVLDKVVAAQRQANSAKEIYQPIKEDLAGGSLHHAKQVSKKIDATNLDIAQAKSQVERVSNILPKLETLVEDLKQKQDYTQRSSSDLKNRIEKLKTQIDFARELANAIKVGVQFHANTTLELQPPENLAQLSNDFKTSAYFRTNESNGFLMYLGNENQRDRPHGSDYMALQIENGYPILTIDLGNGPDKIIGKKNVANGKWHQAIVERTGDKVKLIIREESEDGKEQLYEVDDNLSGDPNNIFDLSRENSKIFVGGLAPDFNVPEEVKYNTFQGEIEDLRVGDERVGLWNFVDGQNNNHGAHERDELIASEIQPTGFRFSGHGHVALNAQYSFKQRSSIKFRFKAGRDVTDGLMFYAGGDNDFIAVELRDGGVYFKYNLGQHLVSIGTSERYNDDEWHWVEVIRNGREGSLQVDQNTVYTKESTGNVEILELSDKMYFGGLPDDVLHSEHLTDRNFDGCIDNVFINGNTVTLSQYLEAYGVRPGCATKFSTVTCNSTAF